MPARKLMFLMVTSGILHSLSAADWPQWRGINRDAVLRKPGC